MDKIKLHDLLNILMIALCAVIAGADNREDVEEFGRAQIEWFQTFLELPNGIPSHDTLTRVFARLNPEQFQGCFMRRKTAVSEVIGGQVIAIMGKCCGVRMTKGLAKRRLTWSAPGKPPIVWSWDP